MKKVNLLLLITLILMPFAFQNLYAKQYVFIGYDSFCGLPIFTGQNPQIATAEKDSYGRPIIHIDPTALANLTSSRIFTLAHECAHHKLGHTSRLGEMERYHGGTRKQELEADCWAAKQLSKYGQFTDLQFQTLKNLADGHFIANGYPSGVERAQNIYSCATGTIVRHDASPRCSKKLIPKTVVVTTYQIIPTQVPCSHVRMGPYGPFAMHQFDIIPRKVPVQTPTTRMVEVTQCE